MLANKLKDLREPGEFVVRATAPRKLILHGEHSVVYGFPALAIPIYEVPLSVTIRTVDGPFFRLTGVDTIDYPLAALQPLFEISKTTEPEKALREKHQLLKDLIPENLKYSTTRHGMVHIITQILEEPLPMHVMVEMIDRNPRYSAVEMKTGGLGTSAACAAALAACLLKITGKVPMDVVSLNQEQRKLVSRYAYVSEVLAHGKASGIDNEVCSMGSAMLFQDGSARSYLSMPRDFRILLVNSRVSKDTVQLVSKVTEFRMSFPDIAQRLFANMGDLAEQAESILHSGQYGKEEYERMKVLIRVNQGLLFACGVSHPKLDEIVMIASKYDFAAKLSGSGGGGVAFVLLPPPIEGDEDEKVKALQGDLKEAGFFSVLLNVGQRKSDETGIRFELPKPGILWLERWQPQNLILHGEHAVIYGFPAVAIPIFELPITVSIKTVDGPFMRLTAFETLDYPLEALQPLFDLSERSEPEEASLEKRRILKDLVPEKYIYSTTRQGMMHILSLNLDEPLPLHATLEVVGKKNPQYPLEEMRTGGLAASAASAAALAACLLKITGKVPVDAVSLNEEHKRLVSRHAYVSDDVAHGKASGIDNEVCSMGSAVLFQNGYVFSYLFMPRDFRILLVNSRVSKDTVQLVSKVTDFCTNLPHIAQRLFASMGHLAEKAVSILHSGQYGKEEYERLKVLIRVNQGLLFACGVSHPKLDEIVMIASKYDFAAKLSGSGGGGVAFVLLPPPIEGDEEKVKALQGDLKEAGFFSVLLNVGQRKSDETGIRFELRE
ncbi:unnamed protein product [Cyprideis torosa]|uniref:GHMP kinase C-terminal domain-containing protein n=1 Tax=Cyprideis torosa TaxID=163714 RepID=A0A7R8W5D3_9CRUS|nr:unnamed protein product [Cyprideis torosa]CAG0884154.1 unnamed protein product [Cyprideis torosa]